MKKGILFSDIFFSIFFKDCALLIYINKSAGPPILNEVWYFISSLIKTKHPRLSAKFIMLWYIIDIIFITPLNYLFVNYYSLLYIPYARFKFFFFRCRIFHTQIYKKFSGCIISHFSLSVIHSRNFYYYC